MNLGVSRSMAARRIRGRGAVRLSAASQDRNHPRPPAPRRTGNHYAWPSTRSRARQLQRRRRPRVAGVRHACRIRGGSAHRAGSHESNM